MLALRTERQITLIVNSFKRVFEKRDIEQLTKQAYNFIMLSSGFIAHYSLYGFRNYYKDVGSLENDIIEYASANQWSNFHPGERDYEYMRQKAHIYTRIVETII
jgi:hypothetical protein